MNSQKEIGGYIEFEHFHGKMLHEDGIKLNCGRSCLAYLIEAKQIKKIAIPYFDCDSVVKTCQKYNVQVRYYHIGMDFLPEDEFENPEEWIYLINYYGQLKSEWIKAFISYHKYVILDNAQAYFEEPIENIDTIYTCRKFFGVADGGILYTDKKLDKLFSKDESNDRMRFLFGRLERSASEFYAEYVSNNNFFDTQSIKMMSATTENILHGLDYELIKERRTKNYSYLNFSLSDINKIHVNDVEGAFMYPLFLDNGANVRWQLQKEKIYIPTLWPDVLDICKKESVEYEMAKNILPLPVDQRYAGGGHEIFVKKDSRTA